MKIVVISDTHNNHKDIAIEECDLLIHCGDATTYGTYKEQKSFFDWFSRLEVKHKIYVPGNHDVLMEGLDRQAVYGIHILKNRSITLGGIKFCGSPYFSRPKRIVIEERSKHDSFRVLYTKAKEKIFIEDCDIRITHSPPYGMLDIVEGTRRGCEILQEITQETKARYHLFGHIHSGYGKFITEDTIFINAAQCNDDNELVNTPIVICI